ncbi:MAG TPA: PEGA domain-containing protein, partial [Kofleriaceae bacterium]|nr:PEGA domain-containing protein [Kofleriaceae bacterium]
EVSGTEPSDEPDDPPDPPDRVAGGLPVVGSGPCRVNLTVTPAGSTVKVDGARVGVSPLALDGPCARRRIDIVHPRYAPVTRYVTPVLDQPESLEVTLVRPTHKLTVVTNPPGATISIEGRRAGTSPTVVQIMGFYGVKVTIEKPGYKTVTQRVYSKVKQDRLTVRMLETFGGRK